MSYESNLLGAKTNYPFDRWREGEAHGLDQYTEENCNAARAIFDKLIAQLINLGESASEENKMAQFKIAVESLNDLNDEAGGAESGGELIETGERDDLCELVNIIAKKSGIDPKKYGSGEGPASEWRDW